MFSSRTIYRVFSFRSGKYFVNKKNWSTKIEIVDELVLELHGVLNHVDLELQI